MKQVIEYINEVKFGVNKKKNNKPFSVYKLKSFSNYYVKVNSDKDIHIM